MSVQLDTYFITILYNFKRREAGAERTEKMVNYKDEKKMCSVEQKQGGPSIETWGTPAK